MALSTQEASTSAPQWKYHVFLSFRGTDVREGFLDHLYDELLGRAINAFRDDPALKKGSIIDKGLMQAIEQSRFSIVIVSKNYAESPWCLLELAHIVQCMQESGTIMPIFYYVDPGDVRRQTGSFAQHFTAHEKKYGKDGKQVRDWKDAMTKLGNLSGWVSENYSDEKELIKEIVNAVWAKVHPQFKGSGSTQKSVGRDGKIKKIDLLLNPEAEDVRFIGIWGNDETCIRTTAELVHTRNSVNFKVSCFLKEIKKLARDKSLVFLQADLVEQLNGSPIPFDDVYVGKQMTKSCVRNKKVLSILNDVDQKYQLEILGGEEHWYGKGSRIIFTSMNRELLVDHGIEERYLVEGLTEDEASALHS